MDVATEKKSPLEEFLREFNARWLKARTFSDHLSAAVDYLKAGPTLAGLVPEAVQVVLEKRIERVRHVGFCVRGFPHAYVDGVLQAAGFSEQHVFPSALSATRTLISALHPEHGWVEVALDDETVDPPHVAWQVTFKDDLMDVGHDLRGTPFSPPDFMKNMIAFNREQRLMFRYFEGNPFGHRLRLEFCW